jgi:hypothetical protein
MPGVVNIISAQAAFDHKRLKIAYFARMQHDGFFWNGSVFE